MSDASAGGELRRRVQAWVDDDPDADTRAELADLLHRAQSDHAAQDELADRFAGRLEFGTAGLRGAIGGGPNRMNRAMVIRAAAGLSTYLVDHGDVGMVAIGYDARTKSDRFAADTGEVLTAAGLTATLLPRPLPTPVLAYAVRHLGCLAGVMVTASHNPPQDNGYKVYLGDGSQIVPPVDAEISAAIDAVESVASVPRSAGTAVAPEGLVDDYIADIAGVVAPGSSRGLRLVYTPLHGVGAETALAALARAGFSPPDVVAEQRDPDPRFPTVAFPNPEEPGALDLALQLAEIENADLVIANDPDADRCAVAVPTPAGWRRLSGDELGILLGNHLLRRGASGVFATTIVSSSLLGKMATAHGVPYVETLTGFKWLGRVDGLAYGYEEALGYCVAPELVRDKDGISAMLLAAELAAELRSAGSSLLDRLDDIAAEYGLHATSQVSVRVDDLGRIDAAMAGLRKKPPTSLGDAAVEQVDDLAEGVSGLPPTEGLRFRLTEGGRVVIRPSGTEPKVKCYLEVVTDVRGGDVQQARDWAADRLEAMRKDVRAALSL